MKLLTDTESETTTGGTETERGYSRWFTGTAAVGTVLGLFMFSLYAPPAIRRALGKDSET